MTTFIKIGAEEYNAADYTIPAERTFREGWEATDGNAIVVNMDKAKEIWRDKIRFLRTAELEKLDADFMKALEAGEDTTAIVAKKQVLRDATAHPDLEAATTPEQLKLVQPIPNVTIK